MRNLLSTFVLHALMGSVLLISSCNLSAPDRTDGDPPVEIVPEKSETQTAEPLDNRVKVAHVIVALCDNENQGIVPVPAHLGNGEDPDKNLYWGAAYGIRNFFDKSDKWERLQVGAELRYGVLERAVYRHKKDGALLVADAYRGDRIRESIIDFLSSTSGRLRENIEIDGETVQIYGGADLVSFVGHNGLMDFDIDEVFEPVDTQKRDAVVLACYSRKYFSGKLRAPDVRPLLWTTNLMAPEAYILHDALEGWTEDEQDERIRDRAAQAYARYQRISPASAKRLIVTGR